MEPPAADDQDSINAMVPAPEEEPRLYQGPEQANMSDPQLKQLQAQIMAFRMLFTWSFSSIMNTMTSHICYFDLVTETSHFGY